MNAVWRSVCLRSAAAGSKRALLPVMLMVGWSSASRPAGAAESGKLIEKEGEVRLCRGDGPPCDRCSNGR